MNIHKKIAIGKILRTFITKSIIQNFIANFTIENIYN